MNRSKTVEVPSGGCADVSVGSGKMPDIQKQLCFRNLFQEEIQFLLILDP